MDLNDIIKILLIVLSIIALFLNTFILLSKENTKPVAYLLFILSLIAFVLGVLEIKGGN